MTDLDRAKELSGDLNAVWDKVVATTKGTPQERDAKRLAQVIEDLEMDIGRLSHNMGGGFPGWGKGDISRRLSQIVQEFGDIKVAVGYSGDSPYDQLQQVRRDLTSISSRVSNIDHPEASKIEKMLDQVRRTI